MMTSSSLLMTSFSHLQVHLMLFEDVTNAAELDDYVRSFGQGEVSQDRHSRKPTSETQSAAKKSLTEEFHLFLNPHRVVSSRYVYCAIQRALERERTGVQRARTIQSEVLLSFAATSQLTDAFKAFGFTRESTEILAVVVCPVRWGTERTAEKLAEIRSLVKGSVVKNPDSRLGQKNFFDETCIMQHHQISEEEAGLPGGLEASLLSRMAVKGI